MRASEFVIEPGTMLMGKLAKTGQIVRIIKQVTGPAFARDKSEVWSLIDTEPERRNKISSTKWVPADTSFEWVRPYLEKIDEISRDRLERYLDRANRQVDTRQERMARARQRLSTSYEIYHAETPNKVVDRFEADTPALAQKYYQDYIERYESDVDYDLRLRRGTGIMESTSNKVSVADMIAYLKTHHDPNLHQDYTDYIENTFDHFVLKNVPTNSIPSELPKLDREKVERYRQMDFSKAPPIVIGDRYILDGYHRLNAAKVLGIPSIRAYVGVKKVAEGYARKLNFDEIYGKYLKVTDNNGDPNKEGFSLVTPLNGDSWNWRERPEFIPLVKKKLNQPGFLRPYKYKQIIDSMAGKHFDPATHIAQGAK